ncbi:alkylphosphonate utilization protein, partial [Bacteriovoracaceae bacterium]|nr:alkylphosphonate utilization protein [Bacteriovoracaceae bacterium]
GDLSKSVLTCEKCNNLLMNGVDTDADHWNCLSQTMWSETLAVQVCAWRILDSIKSLSWANELLEQLYLDDENLDWAKSKRFVGSSDKPKDSNGVVLEAGDSVTLIKDLTVKGANFTAKRGTTVRKISLTDNPEHIEGRVNGQKIVIITKYVKKV